MYSPQSVEFVKMSTKMEITLVALVVSFLVGEISGHGMMLEPPNRSSLWRFETGPPPNYDDNANFCGGVSTQYDQNGGKCGVCGDPWNDPHPQNNENTGLYGTGEVVRQYTPGSVIDIQINLTANHMGYFLFSVCALENPNAPESGEECFQPLTLGTGEPKYVIADTGKNFTVLTNVKLPDGLTCDRCVLRWHYYAGNTWGECDDGTYATGCGPQETFRSCADVAIV